MDSFHGNPPTARVVAIAFQPNVSAAPREDALRRMEIRKALVRHVLSASLPDSLASCAARPNDSRITARPHPLWIMDVLGIRGTAANVE